MRSLVFLACAAAVLAAGSGATTLARQPAPAIEVVTVPVPDSPLVSVRLMFRAGSIQDPKGKEGLSALTALMVGSSGTARRTYAELVDELYPIAARIGVLTGRETIVLASQVHRDTLPTFTSLFLEAVLQPGFREEDFTRNRDQLLAHLTTTLRSANDELLGLEMIQQVIFHDHPYGHAPAGTVEGLSSITLEDVRSFYRTQYTRGNLILGIAGGYDEVYPRQLLERLSALPPGDAARAASLPPPPGVKGRHFTIIEKRAESVGIHFGHPLPVNRNHPDFYALMVANSYLGEHRTFHGRLMQELRGKRGLNYGDYSYIEYWDNAPGTSNPPPNHPRRQQAFSVWVRPVIPENALFALRAAVAEVERLRATGLTQSEFEITRDFLIRYSKLWARSLSDRLGFHMDSRFYAMPYFIDRIEAELQGLTVAAVNRAAREYLRADDFQAVIISDNALALRERLMKDQPSEVRYENPVTDEVRAADRAIRAIKLAPADVRILPIESTFTGIEPRPGRGD